MRYPKASRQQCQTENVQSLMPFAQKLPGRLDVRESVSVSNVVRIRYEELEEAFRRTTAATEWVRLLC